jgi:hypothetical protein
MTHPNARNARLEIDGAVLTLRPNQTLCWGSSHRTDEGYSWHSTMLTYRKDHPMPLHLTRASGGVDCDGETRSVREFCATVTRRPDWEEEEPEEFFDRFAEESGY